MCKFHSRDYIDFIERVTVDNVKEFAGQMQRFNIGEYVDCAVRREESGGRDKEERREERWAHACIVV
jgi:hypothetical protein